MSADYEARKIQEYVRNLMTNAGNNQLVIDSIIGWAQEQPDLLNLSIAELETNSSNSTKNSARKNQGIILKALSIPKANKGQTNASDMEKLLQTISEVFRLSPVEQEIFGLFVRVTQYDFFNDLLERILRNRRRSRYGQLNVSEAIAKMTGRPPQEIANAIKPQEKLMSFGLIDIPDYHVSFEVPDKIKYLFTTGCEFATQQALKNYLVGRSQIPNLSWSDFAHLGQDREIIERVMHGAIHSKSKGINILLHGKPGTGKTEFCRTLAHHLGVSLYAAAEADETGDEPARSDRIKGLRVIQAILSEDSNSCILFDEAEDVFGSKRGLIESAPCKVYMNRQLEENPRPIFWLTNDAVSMDKAFLRRMTYCMEFGELPFGVRLSISQKECEKMQLSVSNDELQKFIREYDLPPSVFSNAVNAASLANGGFAEVRQVVAGSEKLLGVKRNTAACPTQFDIFLINADIELSHVTAAILRGGRRDFSFCLSGPPGTGKSEFARWIAEQLGMEVLFKRSSDLISKWLGETEKNISAAFREAEAAEKLLIFDEADSFLYSRREAQRSWEVSHVNEMLTWMERHPLPFICTTNLSEKIDEAAFRRFTFKTRFDYLKREQIASAFSRFFGQDAPLETLALDYLTPGDFAVVKKKVDYIGGASIEEIGHMLYQETLAKPVRLNSRRVGFKAG